METAKYIMRLVCKYVNDSDSSLRLVLQPDSGTEGLKYVPSLVSDYRFSESNS